MYQTGKVTAAQIRTVQYICQLNGLHNGWRNSLPIESSHQPLAATETVGSGPRAHMLSLPLLFLRNGKQDN